MLPIDHIYPLMCGQRWLLYLLEQSPELAHPVQRIYRLRHPLDTSALLAAFRYVVSVHPALRLRLVETESGWGQYFAETDAEISGVEIRGRAREQRVAYARHILAEDLRKPLDLRTSPPFLLKVIRIEHEHLLSICLDHIAADEIATDVLERELEEAYAREIQGLPHPLSSATQCFYNYLNRDSGQRSREMSNLNYWQRLLEGSPLGHDNLENIEWVKGESKSWEIKGDDFLSLKHACRKLQCSLFSAVLAAQLKLFTQIQKTNDIVVNVPVSNRTQAGDRTIIANLSMLLHLRFRLHPCQPANQFLRSVRDKILESMAHRQYDYPTLSREVAADAARRGGHVNWLLGCSYIIERKPTSEASPLFEPQIDDAEPGEDFHVPRTSCSFTFRQNEDYLRCMLHGDSAVWCISGSELVQRYLTILATLTGTRFRS